jgi:hypothetical protein
MSKRGKVNRAALAKCCLVVLITFMLAYLVFFRAPDHTGTIYQFRALDIHGNETIDLSKYKGILLSFFVRILIYQEK